MLRGEILDDIRQWICGASLMALRSRLRSKVAVELMGSSVSADQSRARGDHSYYQTVDQVILRRPWQGFGASRSV